MGIDGGVRKGEYSTRFRQLGLIALGRSGIVESSSRPLPAGPSTKDPL